MMTACNYIICWVSCKMRAIKRNLKLFTAQFGSLHQMLREVKLTSYEQSSLRDGTQNKHQQSFELCTKGKTGPRVEKLVMICLVLVYTLAQGPTLHPPTLTKYHQLLSSVCLGPSVETRTPLNYL